MSFFKRQPDLFDTKKLGTGHGSGSNLAAAGLALTPPTSAPVVPSAADDGDSVQENPAESWVELAPSRASLCSSIEAVMLESASGGEYSVNKDSRLSPDMLPFADGAKPSDWFWDWSARSEACNVAQKMGGRNRNGGGQVGSTLTTPPNILKKAANRSSVFLRFEVVFGLVFSNLVTFFLGAAIGYCICRKVWKSNDDIEEMALSYYFN
uniref:Uncharacterized protein n=1 Tax=Globodera pallida TaxID=36090 RepID=A0A183CHQ0_GLOPA